MVLYRVNWRRFVPNPSPDRQYGANDFLKMFEKLVLADIHGRRVRPCVRIHRIDLD